MCRLYVSSFTCLCCFPCFPSKPRVSLITITDKIITLDDIKNQIDLAFMQPKLKAVCLKINSPVGSPVQSYLIAEYIRSKEEEYQVPVFCFVEDKAASGGYLVACAATMIFVSRFSRVGSIGVTMTSFTLTKLLDMLGIESTVYTAGSLKGGMNPLSPTNEDENTYIEDLLNTTHLEFIKFVKENRGDKLVLKENKVLFSGAVFGALKAFRLGLVDGLYTVLEDKVGELIGETEFKLVEIKNKEETFGLGSIFGFGSKMG